MLPPGGSGSLTIEGGTPAIRMLIFIYQEALYENVTCWSNQMLLMLRGGLFTALVALPSNLLYGSFVV